MTLEQAKRLREKYLPHVLGKTMVQDDNKPATDIEIKSINSSEYELRVVHHPNPNLNPLKLHRDLKKFLAMHNIPFDENA